MNTLTRIFSIAIAVAVPAVLGAQTQRMVKVPKWKVGLQATVAYSASGHGHFYEAKAVAGYKRVVVMGGFLINQNGRSDGFTGDVQLELSADHNREPDRPLLYAFVSGIYRPSAGLCKTAQILEATSESRSAEDIQNLRLQTYEGYAGFGLKVKVVNNLYWTNGIAFGGYYAANCPTDLYHQRSALGLIVKTGLFYRIK
jgi:hypothetical protein